MRSKRIISTVISVLAFGSTLVLAAPVAASPVDLETGALLDVVGAGWTGQQAAGCIAGLVGVVAVGAIAPGFGAALMWSIGAHGWLLSCI